MVIQTNNQPKKLAITIIRCLGILPITFLGYSLVKLFFTFAPIVSTQTMYEIINYVGFGGHYLIGPLFIFSRECAASLIALSMGIETSPFNKEYTFIALIILWMCFLIYGFFNLGQFSSITRLTINDYLPIATESIAQLTAAIICGINLLKVRNNY